MVFTLPAMFRAKEGQSLVIMGDVKEEDALMAEIVNKKDELKRPSSGMTKMKEFPIECLKKITDNT